MSLNHKKNQRYGRYIFDLHLCGKPLRQWVERSLLREGMIDPEDLDFITFTHDVREAVEAITVFTAITTL